MSHSPSAGEFRELFDFPTCIYSLRYTASNVHAPCCHLWPAWFYNIFPHYLINDTIKKNGHKMCVSTFSTTVVWNIFHSKKNLARCDKNVYWSSCEVPLILVRFCWNLNFLDKVSKNIEVSNFMKICSMGAELFHANRRTDGRTWRS